MVKRDFITSVLLLLASVVIFLLLRLFVFSTYRVGEADANSYLKTGDYMIVVKEEKPDYGDFVVYEVDGASYVGRVMAQGGDKVMSVEDVFYRNNEVVEQAFLDQLTKAYVADITNDLPYTEDFNLDILMDEVDATIPGDNYLILNDDRRNLADSRQFGLIPRSKIKGVLTFRLSPLDEFGFLKTE